MVFSWLNLFRLLFLASMAGFGLWQLRRRSSPKPLPGLRRKDLWILGGILLAAIALRALLMPTLPPGVYELENVPYDRVLDELTDQIGFEPLQKKAYNNYHTPLLPTVLDGWYVLGDTLEIGGSIFWLRLPNLFTAAAFLLLLLRIGRALGVPAAGWGAAAVFAVSPTLAPLSVYQGHYFLEMVTVAWFCERLLAYGIEGRPVHRSLAISAAVALWTGYMTALVVGPGMIVVLAVAWRRGERWRGLAALLVVLALYGPIAAKALETAVDFLAISVTDSVDRGTAARLFALHGHHPMQVDAPGLRGFLRFPFETAGIIFGPVAAAIALLGFLLALIVRPKTAWFPVLVLVLLAAVSTHMAARWVNYTSAFPFLLFVPLWGVAVVGQRLRPRWSWVPAVVLSLALLVGPIFAPPVRDRLPAPADLASWLAEGDRLSQVSAPLQAEALRDLPVLVLAVEKDVYYHPCPDRATTRGYLACKDEYFNLPRQDGFALGTWRGRALAFSRMERIGPQSNVPCPRVDDFGRNPEWRDTPFLVLVTPQFRRYEAQDICQDTFPRGGCSLLVEAVDIQVFRCPPRW